MPKHSLMDETHFPQPNIPGGAARMRPQHAVPAGTVGDRNFPDVFLSKHANVADRVLFNTGTRTYEYAGQSLNNGQTARAAIPPIPGDCMTFLATSGRRQMAEPSAMEAGPVCPATAACPCVSRF